MHCPLSMPSLSLPHLSCTFFPSEPDPSSQQFIMLITVLLKKNLPLSTSSTSTLSFSFMIKLIKHYLCFLNSFSTHFTSFWSYLISDNSVVFATVLLETLLLKNFFSPLPVVPSNPCRLIFLCKMLKFSRQGPRPS